MTEEIKNILKDNSLMYNDKTEDIITFLTSEEDRQFFKRCEIPNDNLLIENSTIIKRYQRFPLIIDPNNLIVQ
jgi:hypothetical protein